MPPNETAATTVTTPAAATRRCWRCLQHFACDADALPAAGPAEWWLCDPCHGSLLGPS